METILIIFLIWLALIVFTANQGWGTLMIGLFVLLVLFLVGIMVYVIFKTIKEVFK